MFFRRSPIFVLAVSIISALASFPASSAEAAPNASSVRARARAEAKAIAKLRKDFVKLPLATRRAVIAALSTLQDSDTDGVPDLLEPRSGNVCDRDSDDDGLDDGDEYSNGSNPLKRDSDGDGVADGEDDDSNGDGQSDSSEVEFKGILQAGSDPFSGTVGTITFRVDGDTLFRKGSVINGLNLADFIGLCVEVEGERRGATITADKVKEDDDC